MNGVNYDTDTMRTDEEINDLIESGTEMCLKKELITQVAVNFTLSSGNKSISVPLEFSETETAIALIFEYDGSLKVVGNMSTCKAQVVLNDSSNTSDTEWVIFSQSDYK